MLSKPEAPGQWIPPPRPSYQCRDPDPYTNPGPWSKSPPQFNHLFVGPLQTFPENFMQIRSEVFCAKLLTDRQTNDDYITSLAEVIMCMHVIQWNVMPCRSFPSCFVRDLTSAERWHFGPARQWLELLQLNLLRDQCSISLSLSLPMRGPSSNWNLEIPLGEFPWLGTAGLLT